MTIQDEHIQCYGCNHIFPFSECSEFDPDANGCPDCGETHICDLCGDYAGSPMSLTVEQTNDLVRACNETDYEDDFEWMIQDLEWVQSHDIIPTAHLLAYVCYHAIRNYQGECNREIALTYFEGWYNQISEDQRAAYRVPNPHPPQETPQAPFPFHAEKEHLEGLMARLYNANDVQIRMQYSIDIFVYLTQHPLLLLQYERLKIVTLGRADHINQECVAIKTKILQEADMEGGVMNQELFDCATTLQAAIVTMRQSLEASG
jgi:hypothetical protein